MGEAGPWSQRTVAGTPATLRDGGLEAAAVYSWPLQSVLRDRWTHTGMTLSTPHTLSLALPHHETGGASGGLVG